MSFIVEGFECRW